MKNYKIVLLAMVITSKLFSYQPLLTINKAKRSLRNRVELFNSWPENKDRQIQLSFKDGTAILTFKNKNLEIPWKETKSGYLYEACTSTFASLTCNSQVID